MSDRVNFKCSSCQNVFKHVAYQEECFCPKCGSVSKCIAEEQGPAACADCGAEIPAGAAFCSVCGCPVPNPTKVICEDCGTEVPAGASACPTCGWPVPAKGCRRCEDCGAEVDASASVCPKCGCPLLPVAPIAVPNIPPVSINQTAYPIEPDCDDEEEYKTDNKRMYYWIACGVLVALMVGIFWYYLAGPAKNKVEEETISEVTQYVVINSDNLRMRYAPTEYAETYKWPDGTNRHPKKGASYPYLGEEGDFYKIDYNGCALYVSKEYSYIE